MRTLNSISFSWLDSKLGNPVPLNLEGSFNQMSHASLLSVMYSCVALSILFECVAVIPLFGLSFHKLLRKYYKACWNLQDERL